MVKKINASFASFAAAAAGISGGSGGGGGFQPGDLVRSIESWDCARLNFTDFSIDTCTDRKKNPLVNINIPAGTVGVVLERSRELDVNGGNCPMQYRILWSVKGTSFTCTFAWFNVGRVRE